MVLASLRARWAGFLGAFVAVALGVALTAAAGVGLAASLAAPVREPVRFAGSPVVVAGRDTLTVPVRRGPEVRHVTKRLAHPHPVDNELLRELRRLGQIHTDRTAPDAVGLAAPVARVRAVVAASGTGARVLTGADRRLVDPATARDAEALVAVNAFLGTAGGVAAFVAVFVTASTFAFVVALRRREFGLLRAAGASRGQVRRWLLGEALVVGAVAAAVGCLGGALGAPVLAGALVDSGVAPPWFTVDGGPDGFAWTWWPYQLAFWTGLLVALAGSWSAARRAGRVSPVEALREASLDTGVLPVGRRVVGAVLLVGGVGLLAWTVWAEPSELLKRKTYTTQPMVLCTGVAALAPVSVRYVVGALRRPRVRVRRGVPVAGGVTVGRSCTDPGRPRSARGSTARSTHGSTARSWVSLGRVARANAAGAVRRTAAIAAPVLVSVAVGGCLLGSAATVGAAKAAEARDRTAAQLIVTGADLRPAGRIPGATVAASARTAVFVREDDDSALLRAEARAVTDPAAFAAANRLPVVAGDVRRLDDRSIVVNEEWQRHRVGRHVDVWLGDGRRARLRIVAVLARGTGDNGAYVTARNAPAAPLDRMDVRLRDGADRTAVAAALRPTGGQVRPAGEWLAAEYPGMKHQTRLGLRMLLALCLAYTAISLASTQLMTAPVRAPELRSLRLLGAAPGQIRLVVAAEAVLAVTVGAVLGLAVTLVGLGGLSAALARLSAPAGVVVPWDVMGVCVGVSVVVAVGAGVLGCRRQVS
ncbi:ABC transporter permease [Streptomyces flavofungini]|uniref:ABC transporter permease n=1 Tax=Streptomyces flavofungini TaxID=68200 RepID=A0ABS0WX90_9ACTN|nr:ABC transporter permease [Streptomyces flavofungini]MBJ3805541.1 ABC transporter permease [Streptomyces flavofungini]GHC73286.1 ABC transporter permease [Streptomyces flavofungini]